jgi:hypothetical protein
MTAARLDQRAAVHPSPTLRSKKRGGFGFEIFK